MHSQRDGKRWSWPSILLALVAPLAARAADPAARFQPVDRADEFAPAVKPIVLDGGPRVQVMVRLSAEPVATAKAQAPGRTLSAAARDTLVRGLRPEHDRVAQAIQARGGKVLTHLYDAWNGLRVEVARGAVADLALLPGVRSVTPVRVYERLNTLSVPYIGAPAVWGGVPGLTGAHVRVAVLDTGIDYTHADFGGPGTPAAFAAASAASTSPADPALFGPNAPKVKGGIDLVGDAYDADVATSVPVPDPNPLDCNGHGSHVAGTIAGFGVNPDGSTYTGPYDATTPSHAFHIGPGVAPGADLYAVRVFGCQGSTSVVTEAIDWAVQHGMQVISMSLGSPFGDPESADAQAADAAAQAGVVVIAASGNNGPNAYLTSAPAAASGALSVAAVDSHLDYPGAVLGLDTGATVTAIDANGATLPAGPLALVVLRNPDGTVSLGCSEAEYVDSVIAGKVVVTQRGTCARIDRATFGARHGAAAVIMINNGPGYPPYEGPIPSVAIPFLGVLTSDAPAVLAAAAIGTLTAATVPNPTARQAASFSSGGARAYDSALKPDVAAPGVSIYSAAVGTGNDGIMESGTSMATPHVSGVAALTVQAHPGWDADALRASIENTADPAQTAVYGPRVLGAGLVQPALSTQTQLVAYAASGAAGVRRAALDFGLAELRRDFRGARTLMVKNLGARTVTVALSTVDDVGAPHSTWLSDTRLVIPGGQTRRVTLGLAVPAASVGDSSAFRQVGGAVRIVPGSGSNAGVALRVPYYLVPRARANVQAVLAGRLSPRHPSANLLVLNPASAVPGTADFYEWGLASPNDGLGAIDLAAAGVQSWPYGSGRLLVFAVGTWGRWSSAALDEFDVLLDVDGDGVYDHAVVAVDYGAITTGTYDGRVASVAVDLASGLARIRFLAVAPTDGSTLLLPVLASDLGLSASQPRFTYTASSYDGNTSAEDAFQGTATFDAWAGALALPDAVAVDPGTVVTAQLALDPATFQALRPLGLLVVRQENAAGRDQVQLVPLGGDR